MLDEQFDALKEGIRRLLDRMSNKLEPEEQPRIHGAARGFAAKTMEVVRAHPIAATMCALGIGYLAVRIARR